MKNDIKEKENKKVEKLYIKLMKKINEDWKYINIDGYETTYMCSNYGRIANTKNGFKILKNQRLPNGYYVVSLPSGGKFKHFYIHRLVAMLFIKIPKKYTKLGFTFDDLEVNHKKGKQKWNNSYLNLEWVTCSDNKFHAYKTNLSKKGEENVHHKYTENQIIQICEFIEENKLKPSEISDIVNVPVSLIHDIKNKGSWNHITSKYNFDDYRPKQKKYSDNQLEIMHKHLENKDISCKEISNITGIPISSVYYYKEKYYNRK